MTPTLMELLDLAIDAIGVLFLAVLVVIAIAYGDVDA